LQEVEDPRQYGVAEVVPTALGDLEVKKVVEKPAEPTSKLAIMPLYLLKPIIFEALEATLPDEGGEIQLTDAIQKLITTGHNIRAIKLREDDIRLDIGTPETYWETLEISHRYALSKAR
jgi:dTDP-glucose pyrophosphorylase